MRNQLPLRAGCILLLCFLIFTSEIFGQCPDITSSSLSGGCFNGGTPCDLCPGEVLTLKAGGSNLENNGCVDWYYSDSQGFNPYNNEGTFIACGKITTTFPPFCVVCPQILAILVDACGTEANNEFMLLSSGSGFNVNSLQIDFAVQNNTMGAVNSDININATPCGFKTPEAALITNLQATASCDPSNIIPLSPGESVPAGAIVAVFTSSNATGVYNFDALCATGQKIYVLQSSCTRNIGAFTNGSGSGPRTQSISLSGCSCSNSLTYTCEDLAPALDGDFVLADGTEGNDGCVAPVVTAPPIMSTSTVADVTFEVTEAMCNNGPFFITGILNPAVPAGCNDEFTDEFQFNVVCPEAMIDVQGPVCFGNNVTLEGSGGGTYAWAGPGGFSSNQQSPVINGINTSKSGTYSVTVTNTAGCTDVTSKIITVNPDITISISPNSPSFCEGQTVTLNGTASGGSGNFSYEWTLPGGGNSSDQSLDVTTGGLFTLVVTDSEGCSKEKSITVTQWPAPVVDIFPDPAFFCNGKNILITAGVTSGSPGFSYNWSSGQMSSSITVTAGTFLVTVTDSKGCKGIDQVITQEYDSISLAFQPQPLILCSFETSDLDVVVSGGIGPFIYTWETPSGIQTGSPITVTIGGNYSVTVTDSKGCTATKATTVQKLQVLTVDINPDPATFCAGGSVLLSTTVTGGSGTGYNYNWTTPGGNQNGMNISANLPGAYSVTVTDSEGCSTVKSTNVSQTSGLSVTINPDPATICPGDSVILSVQINGGNGTYTYQWSGPSGTGTGPVFTANATGLYSITVTDGNGCTGFDDLAVTQSNNISVNITPTNTVICQGSSVLLNANASGSNLIYNWTTPGGPLTGNPITASLAGAYEVTVSSGGCTGVASTTVTVQPNISVIITPPSAGICNGGTIDLTAVAVGTNLIYNWTTPTGAQTGSTITASIAGNYVVTVTDQSGCTGSATQVVTVLSGLDASINPNPASFCANGSVTLTAATSVGVSPFAYSWSSPAGNGSSNTFLANQVGNYAVTITDSKGCTGSAQIPVTQANNLIVIFDPIPPGFCAGKTIDLTTKPQGGQSPYSFKWSSPLGNSTNAIIQTGTPGNYKVTVTDSNGCSGLGEVVVEEYPAPIVNLPLVPGFCPGKDVQLDVTVTDITPPYTYTWGTPTGNQSGPTIKANAQGLYSVTVTNAKSCSAIATVNVSEWPAPVIDIVPDPVLFCKNSSITVTATPSGGTSPYSVLWTGPSFNSTGTSVLITKPGVYNLIVTDANTCSADYTFPATEQNGLLVSLTTDPTILCGVQNFNVQSIVSGGTQPYSYNWNTPSGNMSTQNVAGTLSGNYSVTVTDNEGCSGEAVISVNNTSLSVLVTKKEPVCNPYPSGEINLAFNANTAFPVSIKVNNESPVSNTFNAYDILKLPSGKYDLTITDASGCINNSTVTLNDLPVLNLDLGQDASIYSGETYLINPTANFIIDSIKWDNKQSLNCDPLCISPVAGPEKTTAYTATAFDAAGCFASDQITINVLEKTSVYVPNTFSPDGNGINDKWVIFTDNTVKQIKTLYIYDRWGESIVQLENFPPNDYDYGWNGRFRGKSVESGVYVYYFVVEFENGKTKVFKGDITILAKK